MSTHAAPPPYSGPPTGPPTGPPSGPPSGPTAAHPAQTLDLSRTATIPLFRLVLVELRKSMNTLASFWLVVGIAILVVMVEGLLLVIVLVESSESTPGDYTVFATYITALALPVLAIMLVTTEWTQRTAMVTFSIEPRRSRVMLAKYLVCLVLTFAAVVLGVLVGFVCALICQVALPAETTWDFQAELIVGFFITQTLAMTLGFALAALLLNTPAAIVVFAVYRALPVAVFAIAASYLDWFADIRPWIDFEYAQGPLYDLSLSSAEEVGRLLVSGLIWLGLPLTFGLLRILRAEVK
ncbi:ABC transporter permease [Nocardioides sp.]|uniref:ABC transporter permease n=1 Tax=Nocardioides sp. TaxID=35761 RepID=UPI00271E1504|nr:ABC transporter permease [Nocardioides sp.]MDO9455773.1 ABC transporter permease [Nocardioides sp.]